MKQTIIITGAGSGIGAATAKVLSENDDMELILVGRRKEPLVDVLGQLQNQNQHFAVSCDISDPESFRNMLNEIDVSQRNVTGIFANAGVGGPDNYGKDDRWREIVDINLTGTYISIMETLPHLKRSSQKIKNIVITSSVVARFGVPGLHAYCASKAGLLGLTRSLAEELGPEGIRVNAICPGWVETEMAQESIQRMADGASISYEESKKKQTDLLTMRKMSSPDEIGRLVRFLMTNEETSMTGQSIDINNGSFMI